MPKSAPAEMSCRSEMPAWLNGEDPTEGEGVVNRPLCVVYNGDTCAYQQVTASCHVILVYTDRYQFSLCVPLSHPIDTCYLQTLLHSICTSFPFTQDIKVRNCGNGRILYYFWRNPPHTKARYCVADAMSNVCQK